MAAKKKKLFLIIGVVVLLIAAGIAMFLWPSLIQPLLIVLGILALGWIGTELFVRWKKKRKQKAFDEGISAKEGIEDRKREWGAWTEELDRQGIDRYELPFYLLVGEPQAGKSILLQNSDLQFPFGQDRLSGVGGTRGCDWWFTDEAVILDLAGRLFTHEGGVADKLEWEAFLELLAEFRPLCPANGILLVIPCDSLLSDSSDVCAEKANKIQSALLTLTQKLEAHLPVYLMLTKGDKIFGFAESVHRLEARMRHEMFGWSRPGDRAEAPFDLEEARIGFSELVARARILRERMLATARIPEALPEVDRLYAFPDELAGVWTTLELYLKRIFTESSLVDKTTFRGIYLTSGLQTGAPIARVCGDLLGESGEADARDLEGLFSNQRAYFIKDVVRRRVFEERGLVRPTQGRVSKARRAAMMGYGMAATVAGLSVVGSAWYFFRARGEVQVDAFEQAFTGAQIAAEGDRDLAQLLGALESVEGGVSVEREMLPEVFQSTADDFERLYCSVFDSRLVPELLSRATDDIEREIRWLVEVADSGKVQEGDLFASLIAATDALMVLLQPKIEFGEELDFGDGKATVAARLARRVEPRLLKAVDPRSGQPMGLEFERALARREAFGGEMEYRLGEADLARAEVLARDLVRLYDGVFVGGGPLQPGGELGGMIAWRGLEASEAELKDRRFAKNEDALAIARDFAQSWDRFHTAMGAMEPAGNERAIPYKVVKDQLQKIDGRMGSLQAFLNRESGGGAPAWAALDAFQDFATAKFDTDGTVSAGGSSVFDALIGYLNPVGGRLGIVFQSRVTDQVKNTNAVIAVPTPKLYETFAEDDVYKVCKAEPGPNWSLRGAADGIRTSKEDFTTSESRLAIRVFEAKCLAVARELEGRYPTWEQAAQSLAGTEPADEGAGGLQHDLVEALSAIAAVLASVEEVDDGISDAPEALLLGHLRAIERDWDNMRPDDAVFDRRYLGALASIEASGAFGEGELVTLARELFWKHIGEREGLLLQSFVDRDDGVAPTVEILVELEEHLVELEEVTSALPEEGRQDGEHDGWARAVDKLVAGRLRGLESALRQHWSPKVQASDRDSLDDYADEVLEELDYTVLNDKVKAIGKDDNVPALRANEFKESRRTFEAPFLQAAEARTELMRFQRPNVTELEGSDLYEHVQKLATDCKKARDGATIADLSADAIEDEPLDDPRGFENAGEYYVQELYRGLYDRMVVQIRDEYVQRFREEVLEQNKDLIDALYADGDMSTDATDDRDVEQALVRLLDPGKELDKARQDYRMDPASGLRPSSKDEMLRDNVDLWAFEQFLFDLRDFFQNGDADLDLEDAVIDIGLAVPGRDRAGSIWDPKMKGEGWKQSFFFSRDIEDQVFVNEDGVKDMTLRSWTLDADARRELYFRWSRDVASTSAVEGDAIFRMRGMLAPFLLAWSGSPDDDVWRVRITPDNSNLPAPLEISFPGRTLPERPEERPR